MSVSVLCFNRAKGVLGKLPKTEMIDGIVVRRVSFVDLTYYKPTALPISVLKSHDVIHVHGVGAPLDYVALSKWIHKRPIVVSTHGGIFHTQAMAGLKQFYFKYFIPRIMQSVDLVAACSKNDAVLFGKVSKRVTQIDNAVVVRPYLALSAKRKQRGRCLYVGRLSENKNIDLLLRAAAVAKARGVEFILRVVGPDVDGRRENYEALVAGLGISDRIEFLGEATPEALLHEYELAEIFVSASQYEGFGLSAIEAKASGCRLLLHGNEAFSHMFAADAAAILVDFNDPRAAGEIMADLLQRPPDPTLQRTRFDTEIYSWESKMTEWRELYRLVSGRCLNNLELSRVGSSVQ